MLPPYIHVEYCFRISQEVNLTIHIHARFEAICKLTLIFRTCLGGGREKLKGTLFLKS